ncbi:MAG: adenylyl-sulfate kinase [Alphaproteobacteria bacterium]|nr:adenylyl-sulfate kinase [Alphaproteobacteria bacterium]
MSGVLIWITGFSGAGKTSIASALSDEMRRNNLVVIHIDGNVIRDLFPGLGYSMQDRLANAMRIAKMCAMITDQGVNVICSTISMFSEIHEFNRKHNDKFFTVVVNTDAKIIKSRDLRGIYTKNKDIVGITQTYVLPPNPDLVICNDADNKQIDQAKKIFQCVKDKYEL